MRVICAVLQRGNSPDPLSAGDLSDWQANYGTGSLTGVETTRLTVPEPASAAMSGLVAVVGARSARLRRASPRG